MLGNDADVRAKRLVAGIGNGFAGGDSGSVSVNSLGDVRVDANGGVGFGLVLLGHDSSGGVGGPGVGVHGDGRHIGACFDTGVGDSELGGRGSCGAIEHDGSSDAGDGEHSGGDGTDHPALLEAVTGGRVFGENEVFGEEFAAELNESSAIKG